MGAFLLLAIDPGLFCHGCDRIAETCLRGMHDLARGQQQAISMEVSDLLIGIPVNAYLLCRVLKLEDEGTFATIPRHIKCSPFCVLRHPNAVQPRAAHAIDGSRGFHPCAVPPPSAGVISAHCRVPLPSLECHHAARPYRSSQR